MLLRNKPTGWGASAGVLSVVRRTARFNCHGELILETLCHPGVLRIVLRRLLAGESLT